MRPALLLSLLLVPAFAQSPYLEKPTYARSRDFDLQHLKLDLSFDLAARKILGTATLRVAPLDGDLREISLDSSELAIDGISIAGKPAAFRLGGDKLYVALDRQYPAGTALEIAVRYHAQPRRGLFFVLPDKFHPNRPKQIWADGDTAGGNNRFWFPGYDFPNDKTTTEMIVTVPSGWQTLSNGKLAGVTENKGAGTTTFHWSQEKPMSTYLVSLVAGEFDKGQDKWTVPVEYYVPRGRGADIPRTFGRTVDMLQFFSDHVAPYPWAKYDQSMVDTFGGGMENTSATTEGANAILDARDFEDRKPNTDGLIAHEMAHQWFGDLVTCADWRHTWLNEGFATYFEALWEEHASGRDVFDWKELHAGRNIVAFSSRASVVPHNGEEGGGAYGLIYNKGGWTLQMVRGQLGDARFWKAIQYYVKKYSYQNATTSDFVEAIAEATGQDLEWLFDQYVYQPGHPQFEVAWDYDAGTRLLHLAVQQTQQSAPFQIPIEIEALGDSGAQTFHINVGKKSEDFYFGVTESPRTVLFDPRDIILKAINFKKPAAEWTWQLEHAPRALNRAEAALALGAGGTAALEHAGASDPFYGVRIDAAESLGRIHTEAVRPALLKMLADQSREVRAVAAGALGGLAKNAGTIDRLMQMARTDESPAVRRTALQAAARLKPDQGLDLFKPFLTMDPPNSQMRAAAVSALQSIGSDAVVPLILEASNDENDNVRQNALRALAAVGKGRQDVMDRLLQALDEETERGDRQTAIFALMQRGDRSAIAPLERVADSDPMPNIANAARSAVNALRGARPDAPAAGEDLTALRNRLSQLEKENAELKARLDRLEKR
jgi:aminopeptidase N